MRVIRNGILLSLGIFLLSATALAQDARQPNALVGRGYVFPSSANVAGQFGAYYKTRMVLYNPNPQPITIVSSLSTPAGSSQLVNISIPAFTILRSDNFLADQFSYVGGAGINLIESTQSMSFIAVAAVYTDSANGRFYTPLTGLFTDDEVVVPGSSVSVVVGLQADSSNRANYGCSSASSSATQVRADFQAFTGGASSGTATTYINLPAYGWSQVGVPVQGDDIIAQFTLVSGAPGLGVYCYGVNVNNQSNDGTAIPARTWPPVK